MAFGEIDLPYYSTAGIRARYAKLREECHARYERESVQLNRDEQRDLDTFRNMRGTN